MLRTNRQDAEQRRVEWPSLSATAALIAALVSVGSEARAGDILAGNSNSSTVSNCSGSCVLNSSTSLGLSTWTLNILSESFSETTNALAVPLAAVQLSTGGNNPGTATASFNYNLVLTFTTPTGGFSDPINLTMNGSGNGANSTETLFSFPSLSDLVLPGVTLSNFQFVSTGTGGSFSGGNWVVTRGSSGGNSPTLTLEADVTATAAPIPEPSSLAILGVALAGLGLIRRWVSTTD